MVGEKIWLSVLFVPSVLISKYLKRLDLKTRRDPSMAVGVFHSYKGNFVPAENSEVALSKRTRTSYTTLCLTPHCLTLKHAGQSSDGSATGMCVCFED